MILVVSHKGGSALEHHLDCCGAGRDRPRLLRSFLVTSLDQEAIHDPVLHPHRFAHPGHRGRLQDFGRSSKRHRTPLWSAPNVARLNRHGGVLQNPLDFQTASSTNPPVVVNGIERVVEKSVFARSIAYH